MESEKMQNLAVKTKQGKDIHATQKFTVALLAVAGSWILLHVKVWKESNTDDKQEMFHTNVKMVWIKKPQTTFKDVVKKPAKLFREFKWFLAKTMIWKVKIRV